MELVEALTTTGATREFTDEPVDDATLRRVLDRARFAPSGGNMQAWHVVVAKDPEVRRALRELYLASWYEYLALGKNGLRAWSPVNNPDEEAAALADAPAIAAEAARGPGGFPEHLDSVPALLVILADLSKVATVDRDLSPYPLAGGASVFPFVWSILLSAREEGLGGVITTMLARHRAEVGTVIGAAEPWVTVATLALGHPKKQIRKLRRSPVDSFATIDSLGGSHLGGRT